MKILRELREYKFYTGDRSDKNKISVSEVCAGEVLPVILERQGVKKKEAKLTQATLGSIYDAGLRTMLPALGMEEGERINMTLPNGVVLTGEPDIIDRKEGMLYDAKLSKNYALKMCKADDTHHYKLQVNYYRMMMNQDEHIINTMGILWGLKDQTEVGKNASDNAIMVQRIDKISDSWLIDRAVEISTQVKDILEGKEDMPERCNDTWNNNMRCKHYCDVAPSCPYGKQFHGISSW